MDLWLDDPDPHIRELAMIAFLDDVFGRGFLERWARMKDCEDWMRERLHELLTRRVEPCQQPRAAHR
jgi:hypothetical protein